MKKIMLFEPGLSTDNLGDQIIVDGVKAAFKQIMDGETCYGFNFPYILTCDKQIFEHLMKNAPMGGYSKRIFLLRTVGWFRGMKLLIVNFISKSRKKLG